jgi:hypothetical protein
MTEWLGFDGLGFSYKESNSITVGSDMETDRVES